MALDTETTLPLQLEQVLNSTRNLVGSLQEEKKKSQKIAQEYVQVRGSLEDMIRTLKTQAQAKDQEIGSLQKILAGLKANDVRLDQQIELLRGENQKIKGIVHEQALIVEQQKKKLQQGAAQDAAIATVTARNQELEAAIQVLSKKLQESQSQKLDIKQEIQRIHLQLKTQYQKQITEEATRIKSRLQEEARAEVKKAKNNLERNLNAEMDRIAQGQIQHARTLETRAEKATAELEISLHALERSRAKVLDLEDEVRRQKELTVQTEGLLLKMENAYETCQTSIHEMKAALNEQDQSIAILRLEKQKAELRAEESEKNLSKTQLIERLKYETEISALKGKLEQMERARVFIQKVEGPVEGPVLLAEPDQEIRH